MLLVLLGCFLCGCILVFPYMYCSGVDLNSFWSFASVGWIPPFAGVILFFVFMISNKNEMRNTFIVGIYFCLPIIFYQLSKLAETLGYSGLGRVLYYLRYPILLYVFIFITIFTSLFWYIKGRKKRMAMKKRINKK